jgi:hypothetical protein
MAKSAIQNLRDLVDNEKMSGRAVDWLSEYGDIEEWAAALDELREQRENAESYIQEWVDFVGSFEEKGDARQEALDALQAFVEAWDAVTALPGIDELIDPA